MRIALRVVAGKNAGQEIAVQGPRFLIGRASDCHLRPHSEQVSRYHCAILIEPDGLAIRDYGSRNGTFVDGQRAVDRRALQHGCRIQVGPLAFDFCIGEDSEPLVGETSIGAPGSDTSLVVPAVDNTAKRIATLSTTDDEPFDVLQLLSQPSTNPAEKPTVVDVTEEISASADEIRAKSRSEEAAREDTTNAAAEGLKKMFTPRNKGT